MTTADRPQVKGKVKIFFDLADDEVMINFKSHIHENSGFQQMIHIQSQKEGRNKDIRIDLADPFHPHLVKKIQIRRILRFL
jgi:hypothetical protein